MKKPAAWICVNEKTLLDSAFMGVIQRDCRSSEDNPADTDSSKLHRFYLFKSRDWCNIIPITEDGKVVMVHQYRIGISDHTVEIPGGVADHSDESMQMTALRELAEETGYEPVAGARCVKLGWTYPNPAIQDNRCHSFVVGPVRKTRVQQLDPSERIEVTEVPIEDIPQMILSGELSHALMLNTFLFLMLHSQGGAERGSDSLGMGLRNFQRL